MITATVMAMMRIATAPMMAGVLSGEEELWSDSEVSMTSSSGFIVEVGSVIEVTLFGLTGTCTVVEVTPFGLTAAVVGLRVGGSRHSSSLRDEITTDCFWQW